MKTIGCVGSRELTPAQLNMCYEIGFYMGKHGVKLASGNAIGADAAFAKGVNQYAPENVTLYTPWANHNRQLIVAKNKVECLDPSDSCYEEHAALAERVHPHWKNIGRPYIRSLFIRNAAIVSNSDFIIAFPSTKKWSGTKHSMEVAAKLGCYVYDLSKETNIENVFKYIDSFPEREETKR